MVPIVRIPLQDLIQGFYPEKLPKDKWLIVVCGRGFISGRASDYLKRTGYNVKILLGGIESLDNLVDLKFNDSGFF